MALLQDEQNPKVCSHAAAAITTFCAKSNNPEVLRPYADEMLKRLYTLLSSRTEMVLVEALTAIAAMGSAIGESFIQVHQL